MLCAQALRRNVSTAKCITRGEVGRADIWFGRLQELVGKITGSANDAAGQAKGAASEATGSAKGAASDVSGSVQSAGKEAAKKAPVSTLTFALANPAGNAQVRLTLQQVRSWE